MSHQDRIDPPVPPMPPPTLWRLDVLESDELVLTYRDVTGSSLAAPSVFRFETLDGKIRLLDMVGRDFVLTPQRS